jgi:DNA-binding transcriptional ArsR family regulator
MSNALDAEILAGFASLIAERSRAAMCLALLDGRAWTAGELAVHAAIARSTATEHVNVLVEAGLFSQVRQGRHRYVRLAGPEVAQFIEDLAALSGPPVRRASFHAVRATQELAAARTCYDHLAGRLGVALFDGLVAADLIAVDAGLMLTPAGRMWFSELAGESALAPHGSRPLLRTCLDWTQRRAHLGGALGATLCRQFIERSWVIRSPRNRAVTLAPAGSIALRDLLDIPDALAIVE